MPGPERDDAQFYEGFMDDYFAECDEHLTAVRRLLLDVERRAGYMPAEALQELFRSFHSVKGLSGMVGLREAELLSHHMESYLRVLRDTQAPASNAGVGALIHGTHALEQVIAATRGQIALPDIAPVVDQLAALGDTGDGEPARPVARPPAAAPPSAEGARGKGAGKGTGRKRRATDATSAASTPPGTKWRVVFAPTAELAARGNGVDRVRALLSEAGHIVDATPRVDPSGAITFEFVVDGDISTVEASAAECGLTITPVSDIVPATVPTPAVSAPLAPSHFVRVDLSRLDDLMRMIGDLVIHRARLAATLARIEPHVPPREWRLVQESSLGFERQLRDLREGVMRVRLVPVGEIFRRMPFVVRDLARETGRHVQLVIEGQDTVIDKFVVERLMDPILHLVRNAISHGIEPADVRVAAGKPADGRLTLAATSVGDLVVLQVADDGAGVDEAAVVARAHAVGIPMPPGKLDHAALLALLCTPGFSTRDAADRASGRGVGMAVVETAVQELGGRLTLDTTPGQGTRFTLEVPLTLSITDAILGRVGTQMFALPQSAVHEVIEVMPGELRRVEQHEIAPYRDDALPIVRLSTLFGLAASPGRSLHVFVIGRGRAAVGLAVDRIIGQREVVVRPLTDALIKVRGVSGATDLGDGRAVLILDPLRLADDARERRYLRTATGG